MAKPTAGQFDPSTRIVGADGNDWSWAYVIFKMIPDFPNYAAGSNGSVWWWKPASARSPQRWWRPVRATPCNAHGHLRVGLYQDGVRKRFSLHSLILTVFMGERPSGLVACHFPDRNPANNDIRNLRWATRKDNERDAVIHGTRLRGSRCYLAKLTEDKIPQIRSLAAGGQTSKQLAKTYGVHYTTINKVLNGSLWGYVQ